MHQQTRDIITQKNQIWVFLPCTMSSLKTDQVYFYSRGPTGGENVVKSLSRYCALCKMKTEKVTCLQVVGSVLQPRYSRHHHHRVPKAGRPMHCASTSCHCEGTTYPNPLQFYRNWCLTETGSTPKLLQSAPNLYSNKNYYYCFWFKFSFTSVWEATWREQWPFHQESSVGWRKDEARPPVVASALSFLQCFWHWWLGDRKGIQPPKYLCHLSPKILFWNKVEEENPGVWPTWTMAVNTDVRFSLRMVGV